MSGDPETFDALQAVGEQNATKPANWFKTIHTYSQRSKRRQSRFNKLALFTPRQTYDPSTGKPLPPGKISTLLHNDPADVELLLERRDRYMAIRDTITALHAQLRRPDDYKPAELAMLMTRLRTLETEGERQLKAMEEMLWRHRDREHSVMTVLAKLVSEAGRLNLLDRQHNDRMRLERAGKPSNSELEEMEREELRKLKEADRAADEAIPAEVVGTRVDNEDDDEGDDDDA